jgi:hypothetical protein
VVVTGDRAGSRDDLNHGLASVYKAKLEMIKLLNLRLALIVRKDNSPPRGTLGYGVGGRSHTSIHWYSW